MAILEVTHIGKHFGRTNVLKDVSFSMEEGTALAIFCDASISWRLRIADRSA